MKKSAKQWRISMGPYCLARHSFPHWCIALLPPSGVWTRHRHETGASDSYRRLQRAQAVNAFVSFREKLNRPDRPHSEMPTDWTPFFFSLTRCWSR